MTASDTLSLCKKIAPKSGLTIDGPSFAALENWQLNFLYHRKSQPMSSIRLTSVVLGPVFSSCTILCGLFEDCSLFLLLARTGENERHLALGK